MLDFIKQIEDLSKRIDEWKMKLEGDERLEEAQKLL
jgi:hypothetical protein